MAFQTFVSRVSSDGILRAYVEEHRGVHTLNLRISLPVVLNVQDRNFQKPHFTASRRSHTFEDRKGADNTQM